MIVSCCSLVLVHGSFEDGDLDWAAMIPHLRERFTCYLMSGRAAAARQPTCHHNAASRSASNYFADAARYLPNFLAELEQETGSGFSPTDPAVLAKITAPVLLLHGSRSALRDFFTAGVRHVAEHVPHARVREIPGSGHWGITLAPGPIAAELTRFLGPADSVASVDQRSW